MIAAEQYKNKEYQGYYNVGPDDNNCCDTGKLVSLFIQRWGEGLKWESSNNSGPHEASYLRLDCSKLKSTFKWKPVWTLDEAVKRVVEWSKCWYENGDIEKCTESQINDFCELWQAVNPF